VEREQQWLPKLGLITLAEHINTNPVEVGKARRAIEESLADHHHSG
jgi:hypothetical protein